MTRHSDITRAVCALAILLLAGCATPSADIMQEPVMAGYGVIETPESHDGSIYSPDAGMSLALFSDVKARRVGDIVTIYLVEQTSGQNSSDSSLSQSTSAAISSPTFDGRTRPSLGLDLSSGRNFTGDSDNSQSNQLNGSITVTVRDILPGGNLLVAGEKWIQINQSKEHIALQGVIRIKDIKPDNTVYSTQVADARITYAGVGINKDINTMGWAARIVFNSIWPF